MKRTELLELRELVKAEKEKERNVQVTPGTATIQRYLSTINGNLYESEDEELKNILNIVLLTFGITETNGIYVCTSAWYTERKISHPVSAVCLKECKIDYPWAEFKTYVDIESAIPVGAVLDGEVRRDEPLIEDFERQHIVLNPYNDYERNMNGYSEVRFDYFKTALEQGDEEAVKLVLAKYPQIKRD